MATQTCPWCAEDIAAQAIRCRYCGSRVAGGFRDRSEWHRDSGGRSGLDRVVEAVRARFGDLRSAASLHSTRPDAKDATSGDHAGGCPPTRN
jgi:hypothetical protein